MLHKRKVAQAMWINAKRQVRRSLGLPQRVHPWPTQGLEAVIRHHGDLVRLFLEHKPKSWDLKGKTVCETGCSDCLAIAGLIIGMGASHVDLVEPSEPILNHGQMTVLEKVRAAGFALDTSILRDSSGVSLDPGKVTFLSSFMEQVEARDEYDYLFSFHVMEHVEDLDGFYAACCRTLKPGGQMFHCIDFSGHCELEDPVPPLDFQTYSDWFYGLMYPRFFRATRSFLSDHREAMKKAGLMIGETKVTRRAEPEYVASIWPKLRSRARSFTPEEIGVLEAVLLSSKP